MKPKETIRVGKVEITYSHWSNSFTFTNREGFERRVEYPQGHALELFEVIKLGSGKAIAGNVHVDHTHDGLPPTNLQKIAGGSPEVQHGTFLGGDD